MKLPASRQPVQFVPQWTVHETASNTNNTKDWNQQTMSGVGNAPATVVSLKVQHRELTASSVMKTGSTLMKWYEH